MKINTISAQNFRAFYQNTKAHYTEEQLAIVDDIFSKSTKMNSKFDKTSLLGHLKAEYNIDLYADPATDNHSINLYLSEDLPATNENPYKTTSKLTFINTYNSNYEFDINHVVQQLKNITGERNSGIVNTISTIIATLGLLLIPALGIAALIKDKPGNKVENIIKCSQENLKHLPKDTLNLTKKIIK